MRVALFAAPLHFTDLGFSGPQLFLSLKPAEKRREAAAGELSKRFQFQCLSDPAISQFSESSNPSVLSQKLSMVESPPKSPTRTTAISSSTRRSPAREMHQWGAISHRQIPAAMEAASTSSSSEETGIDQRLYFTFIPPISFVLHSSRFCIGFFNFLFFIWACLDVPRNGMKIAIYIIFYQV